MAVCIIKQRRNAELPALFGSSMEFANLAVFAPDKVRGQRAHDVRWKVVNGNEGHMTKRGIGE